MRRFLPLAGAALFLLSCALARGGLFGAGGYGDADLYGHYAHLMATGRWPYRDFYATTLPKSGRRRPLDLN